MLNVTSTKAIDNTPTEWRTGWDWRVGVDRLTVPMPIREAETNFVNLPEKEQEEIRDEIAQKPPQQETDPATLHNKTRHVPLIARGVATRPSFMQALQEWEGYVTAISDETFTALLIDVTAGSSTEEEEVELLLDDLSQGDLELLKLGAIFRWVIGYLRDPNGSKRRVSQIVFRRLPAWTKMDLLSARQRAQDLKSALVWED